MSKRMFVCPHDTAKNEPNWIDLVAYISKHLDKDLSYTHTDGFETFRSNMLMGDIVYANPMDAYTLWKEGYIVVAGNDNYDSAYLVKLPYREKDFSHVASVYGTYAHVLGLALLTELGVDIFKTTFSYKDSWADCIKALLNSEVPMAIVYKDYWNDLSNITKSKLEVVASRQGRHSHYMMLKPGSYERGDVLKVLLGMKNDPLGQKIMQAVGISEWIPKEDLRDLEERLIKLGLVRV